MSTPKPADEIFGYTTAVNACTASLVTPEQVQKMIDLVRVARKKRLMDHYMEPSPMIPFRVQCDYAPVVANNRFLITSTACCDMKWNPPPASRFVEYGERDFAWMEPLGLGRWA